jgi:hypothetical protein
MRVGRPLGKPPKVISSNPQIPEATLGKACSTKGLLDMRTNEFRLKISFSPTFFRQNSPVLKYK